MGVALCKSEKYKAYLLKMKNPDMKDLLKEKRKLKLMLKEGKSKLETGKKNKVGPKKKKERRGGKTGYMDRINAEVARRYGEDEDMSYMNKVIDNEHDDFAYHRVRGE